METGITHAGARTRVVEAIVGRDAGDRPARSANRPGQVRAEAITPAASAAPVLGGDGVGPILERLSREVGAAQFERYFQGQARVSLADGHLRVTVPSGFLAELLNRRFGEQIRRAANGCAQGVEFKVDRAAFEAASRAQARPVAPRATPIVRAPETSRYRFDTFLVGRSNRLAFSACQRVAEDDASVPPIFLHGSCGLGKTHLLRACASRFLERRPGATVRYTTGEQFTNEFIQAVRAGKIDSFRRVYRRVDLLCLDEVNFFSNKDATQAELLHTLDAVGIDGARLVLASDEHPKEIAKLSERLVSRFMAGAVVKLDLPDPELRSRLVRHLADRRGLALDEGAADLVAERSARSMGSLGGFGGSVREIEGLLNQIDAVARLLPELGRHDGCIGVMLVRKALGLDEANAPTPASPSPARLRRPVTAETIIGEICRELGVDLHDFMGKGRHKRVVLARSLVASISRRLTTMSFPEIARAMGRSNHSTVITAQKRLDKQVADDPGRPLTSDVAGAYAGSTLREVYEAMMRKAQA
ncbi:MAG: DnaA/Hda family protein [Planctomycetota bacterium]|nr:DnaA/Hda family protein [Planctomycetota bacterium]